MTTPLRDGRRWPPGRSCRSRRGPRRPGPSCARRCGCRRSSPSSSPPPQPGEREQQGCGCDAASGRALMRRARPEVSGSAPAVDGVAGSDGAAARGRASGSVSVKAVLPGEEVTSSLPSIRSASSPGDRQAEARSPARCRRCGSGRTRAEGRSGGMPGPSSVTVSSTVGRPFLSAGRCRACDHHRRALAGVRESVVEQHPQDLGDALGVALRLDSSSGSAVRDLDLRSLHGGRGGELARDLAGQRPQRHRLQLELERSGVEAREVEQVGRQLLEPVDLLAHRGQELRAGRLVDVLVLEQLDEAAEREDRRAQLVRGVGDELLAGLVEAAPAGAASR